MGFYIVELFVLLVVLLVVINVAHYFLSEDAKFTPFFLSKKWSAKKDAVKKSSNTLMEESNEK